MHVPVTLGKAAFLNALCLWGVQVSYESPTYF